MRNILAGVLIFASVPLAAAQEKRVPSDSARITVPGCAKDRVFIVGQPEGRDSPPTDLQVGRRLRLSGSRNVLNDIKKHEGRMVDLTGLVRKSDLAGPGGLRVFGGRVRIGGAQPQDPIRDPMYNQVVIDVEGFQLLPDGCPTR